MKDLDQKIEQALRSTAETTNDLALLARGDLALSDEATVMQEIANTFKGKYRWIMAIAWLKMIGLTAALVFSVYQFFVVESTRAMLAFASLSVMCIVAMVAIQMFFWVFMNRTNTMREIKRLELQMALMNARLDKIVSR